MTRSHELGGELRWEWDVKGQQIFIGIGLLTKYQALFIEAQEPEGCTTYSG